MKNDKNKNLVVKNEEEKKEEKKKPGKSKKELTTKVLGLLQKKGPPAPLK